MGRRSTILIDEPASFKYPDTIAKQVEMNELMLAYDMGLIDFDDIERKLLSNEVL